MSEFLTNTNEDYTNVQYKVSRNAAASKVAGRDVFSARVIAKETYSTKQLAERMVSEGCAVKATTIRLVLTEFADLIGKLMAEGRAVNIGGLVRFRPSVRGTFDSVDAAFNTAKNAIVVNASIGSRMRAAAALSGVKRLDDIEMPVLQLVIDRTTQKRDVITSEGAFNVAGEHLTWDAAAEDEGWFISYGGFETKCTPAADEQDPANAALTATQTFTAADEEIQLIFRTRMGGEVLHQVIYANPLVTAVNG